jgi:hypothetical protein
MGNFLVKVGEECKETVLRFPGYAPVSLIAPDERDRQRHRERPVRPHGNSNTTKERSRPIWPRHYDNMEQRCARPALVCP